MIDERLMRLESRWRESNAAHDEAAYLVESIRLGENPEVCAAANRLTKLADAITDEAGTPIDSGVRSTVLNLWRLGFWTSFSCEGHMFEGLEEVWSFCGPKIVLESPSPFDQHPLDVSEVDPTAEERAELRRWMVSNLRQQQQVVSLLEQFYRDRECPFVAQLIICPIQHEWGVFSLQSLGADAARVLPGAEQQRLLNLFQVEIQAFSNFLNRQPEAVGRAPKGH